MASITIIGIRGAGKSNVSRRLAVMTKRSVFATDSMLEYESGDDPIAQVVREVGWPEFRRREQEVLRKIVRVPDIIIDAGGGLVVRLDELGAERYNEENVALLRRAGDVFWLRGDVERLVAKVEAKGDRPALASPDELLALMYRREEFYRKAATAAIDIEGKRREDIALEILDQLGLRPAGSP